MAVKVNGVEVDKIVYNGTDFTKFKFNGDDFATSREVIINFNVPSNTLSNTPIYNQVNRYAYTDFSHVLPNDAFEIEVSFSGTVNATSNTTQDGDVPSDTNTVILDATNSNSDNSVRESNSTSEPKHAAISDFWSGGKATVTIYSFAAVAIKTTPFSSGRITGSNSNVIVPVYDSPTAGDTVYFQRIHTTQWGGSSSVGSASATMRVTGGVFTLKYKTFTPA